MSEINILNDWIGDEEQPYVPKVNSGCGCNICPDENGQLLKENYLGEFLTEADKKRARDNLGIEDIDIGGDASNIDYTTESDPTIATVKDALDKIFYVPFSISSFSVSPSESEVGSTVNKLVYNWRYNKDIVSQTFDGATIDKSIRTKTIEGTFKTNISKSISATDGSTTRSASATLSFKEGRYYGVSATDPTVQEIVSSFTRSLSLGRGNSFTVNAKNGQYIYLLVPYSLKDIAFSVGGFEGGFFIVNDNYQFTRYEGSSIRCVLFRSDNPGLGSTTVTIK